MKFVPTLVIHGGAGKRPKDKKRLKIVSEKLKRILELAYKRLLKTNALEAVVYAVELLENDPFFNAGTGASLQADGRSRLSASIMDGHRKRFAGVINLENIKNPVRVAQKLVEEEYRVLAGKGAFLFAKKMGFRRAETRTKASIQKLKRKKKGFDTVGACALDRFGHLASATSTGGRGCERPGRVSDSPMPVANYATLHCAISASGIGEEIIEEGLAIRIAQRVSDGAPLRKAFYKTFTEVKKNRKKMGAIGLDKNGKISFAHTTECFSVGWMKKKQISVI